MTHPQPCISLPRRRDDGTQADRGSRVTTPTAELSNQEQRLLGDILDWSLDTSSSGYEGDQEESEGEKDGDCESRGVELAVGTKVPTFIHLRVSRKRVDAVSQPAGQGETF